MANFSFSTRIALYFGGLFLLATFGGLLLWYQGLPWLELRGAGQQRLRDASRTLEMSADHQRQAIEAMVMQRRGDVLVMSENKVVTRMVHDKDGAVQRDMERIFDRLQRAYPDAYQALQVVDPVTRKIMASTQPAEVGSEFPRPALIDQAARPGNSELIEQMATAKGRTLVIVRQMQAPDADGFSQARLAGVLLVYLDAAHLISSAIGPQAGGIDVAAASVLRGPDGYELARYPLGQAGPVPRFMDPPPFSGFEGTLIQPDLGGREWIQVYRHLPLSGRHGWQLTHYQPKDQALSGLRRQIQTLGVAGLLMTAVALGLIALAARRLTHPLRRLAEVARQLGTQNLLVRATSGASDSMEVIELAESFNAMADSIAKAHHELEDRVHERTLALARERDTAQRYLDIAGVMLIVVDRQARIAMINRKGIEVLGRPESELIGVDWFVNYLPPDKGPIVRQWFDNLMLGEAAELDYHENRIVTARGETLIMAWNNTVLRDADGKPLGILSSGENITERKRAEERLQLAASVFSHAREGIMITDAAGSIIEVNDTFTAITGYERNEVLGRNPRLLHSGRQGPEFYANMWSVLKGKGHWYGEVWNRRKGGDMFAELLTISVVRDADGRVQHYVALFTDITPMKEHEKHLEHIAYHDALTSLPNRVLLADRLQQAMSQSQRRNQSVAVAFLDLDGFKAINDKHDHNMGDQLLIVVAQRMKLALREGDSLARIGGDEFVAVLVDLESPGDCEPVLQRLLQAAADPVQVGDVALQVSASIGVTIYPQDDADPDQLMRHADQAMYQAKQGGKNRFHLFDVDHDVAVKTQRESLEHVRQALVRREFVLHYQPKVNMRTGEVLGVEALIRWQHPERGLLPPGMFLPTIENHALSLELGEWVIDTALSQMDTWRGRGLDMAVSVNIGARQLQQGDFAMRLSNLLDAHPEVQPFNLELEVLETSAMEDMAQVSRVMHACRALGVRFALDDFGTGYSSLSYLKLLPAELLKIDQSFVRDMLVDPDDRAIVESVIGLAIAFRRDVIAEGVETLEHGVLLLELGCDLAQGYGIGRPMPAIDLPRWVETWRPDPAWVGAASPA